MISISRKRRLKVMFALLLAMVTSALGLGAAAQDVDAEGVTSRGVDIWSEGTRMAGDLYFPAEAKAGAKLPTIVMSHGWGGTKAGLVNYAKRFADEGYIVLAFDYRGWGESDSRMVLKGEEPEADSNGEATVRVQLIRTVVDPFDQIQDIQRAFDFIEGEPLVDTERIGYWGSSYSGAHAVWVAANEPRAKCVVGQVAAADSLDLAQHAYENQAIDEVAHRQAIDRARGVLPPVPQGTNQGKNLRGWAILDKVTAYSPVEDASRITIPMLLIDAENEELFDRHKAGELAVKRAKANGAEAAYHVVPDITHYGIYRQSFDEATKLAVDWYNEHLKGGR